MAALPPQYPKRPPFFANRFCRLMGKVCLANQIGPEACYLLTTVAMIEDAKSYRGAVTFFNEQLMPLVGCRSVDSLARFRAKCVAAGWLHYRPGGKGVPGTYWVTVPAEFERMDDAPVDENAAEYRADASANLRKKTGGLGDRGEGHTTAELRREAGEKPRGSAERTAREAGEKPRTSAEHSSLTCPLPVPRQEDIGGASPAAVVKSPASRGPHAEAVAGFCDRWRSVYGRAYSFNAGKDGAAVKWMLGQVADAAELLRVFDRYLADRTEFVAEARHTLGLLRAQFARWSVDPVPARPRSPPVGRGKTAAEQDADYFAEQAASIFDHPEGTDP